MENNKKKTYRISGTREGQVTDDKIYGDGSENGRDYRESEGNDCYYGENFSDGEVGSGEYDITQNRGGGGCSPPHDCENWPHGWIHCIVGPRGPKGPRGDTGPMGERGCPGPRGPKGDPGCPGPPGARGAQGPRGDMGPNGERGPEGPEGRQGDIGPEGPPGKQGIEGPAGQMGPQGPQGSAGCPGPQGEMGPQGDTGPAGAKGETGPMGPQGIPGPPGEVSALLGAQFATDTTSGSCNNVIGDGETLIFNAEITGAEPEICYNPATGEFIFNCPGLYVVCTMLVATKTACGCKTRLKLVLNGQNIISHDIALNNGCYNHLNFTDIIKICEPGTVLKLVNCGTALKLANRLESAAEITIFGVN